MTEDMRRAKARVLEVYLEAFDSMLGIGIYNMPRYRAEAVGVEQKIIGEDWIDAASRLPAEPKIETIEQIFDRHDEVFRNHAMNDSYPEEAEGGGVEQPQEVRELRDLLIEVMTNIGALSLVRNPRGIELRKRVNDVLAKTEIR